MYKNLLLYNLLYYWFICKPDQEEQRKQFKQIKKQFSDTINLFQKFYIKNIYKYIYLKCIKYIQKYKKLYFGEFSNL